MNLSRLIERHAGFQPRRTALSFEGRDLSYRELWERIDLATAGLARTLGVRRGDHVAYLGFNHPDELVLLFALARLGAVLVPLNYRLAIPELEAIVRHAGAHWLAIGPGWENAGADLCSRITGLRSLAVPFAWPAVPGRAPPAAAAGPDAADAVSSRDDAGRDQDPILIVYTSGTTGAPKGVVHSQSGLIWNAVNAIDCQEITRADHVLCVLPLFHVGGMCIQTLPALHAGARVTLHHRFDPGAWIADVAARRPTLSLLVPATMKAVLEHPDFPAADLSSLRILPAGSSIVPEPLIRGFIDRGVAVTQVYGSTETGPVSIYLKAEDARRKLGSAGKAGLHVEIRLVGPDGREVPPGAVGEIWVKAPNVMLGYWRDPDNPSFRDGWFRSGDLAQLDEEGYFRVVGRSKDMIISGGENIYPAELENLLSGSPDIVECAVVGEEDPRWGEIVVAAVVRRPGSALDEAGVMRLFDGRIARYKHPKRVEFVEALPKNALGKVQKPELRRALAAGRGG